MITDDVKCISQIKSRIAMVKAAFKKKTLFTSRLDLNLRRKLVKCYVWSIALCVAETWTLRKVYQKNLGSFEMWCWRKMEKASWTNRVRDEVLPRVQEERNILQTIKRRKASWIGHVLCSSCLLNYVTEGKIEGRIEVTGKRGRRRKQLMDDLKEKRGYWKLKEEALDRTLWRTRFGIGYGSVVRQITE
jgi:hypothetical protein